MSYGEPEDVPGECNARLFVGDNFGDNHVTFRCQREPGHEAYHVEHFGRGMVTWEHDERPVQDPFEVVEALAKAEQILEEKEEALLAMSGEEVIAQAKSEGLDVEAEAERVRQVLLAACRKADQGGPNE